MTIPTREEALAALNERDDSHLSDHVELCRIIRSYIESHTGEVVALEWVGKTLNYNGLGIGRIWMESRGLWNTQLGSRGDTEIAFGYPSREEAQSVLEQSAKNWLSIGDK